MSPLPIIIASNENPPVCASCGGQCCKRAPGEYHPYQLPSRRDILSALETGRAVVDWWEGDVYKPARLYVVYYLRPPTVGDKETGGILPASWGGTCALLGDNGCSLSFLDRPYGCQTLLLDTGGVQSALSGDYHVSASQSSGASR